MFERTKVCQGILSKKPLDRLFTRNSLPSFQPDHVLAVYLEKLSKLLNFLRA